MKRAGFTLILFMLLTATTGAQESHVQIRYEKSVASTVVTSDALYVINSPSQFMQIQLTGRYPGKGKAAQLPDRLFLEIYSFAPDALYQLDAKHRLLVKAGDKVIDFGLLSYSNAEGKAKKQSETDKSKPPRTNIDFKVSLPSQAVITKARKKDELTVEFLSIEELTLGELKVMAGASDLVMKIGDTVFPFRPIHMAILREFTEAITPENADALLAKQPPPVQLPAEIPSARAKTSLADTLRWLNTQIERNGSTNDYVTPRKFETLKFESCQIAYRTTPLIRTSQVSSSLINPIIEYRLDLADLNPEALTVSDLRDYAETHMMTRDYQPKIQVFSHANDAQGMMGRTLEEWRTQSVSINFKNKSAALHFKAALAHAINLCHAQR